MFYSFDRPEQSACKSNSTYTIYFRYICVYCSWLYDDGHLAHRKREVPKTNNNNIGIYYTSVSIWRETTTISIHYICDKLPTHKKLKELWRIDHLSDLPFLIFCKSLMFLICTHCVCVCWLCFHNRDTCWDNEHNYIRSIVPRERYRICMNNMWCVPEKARCLSKSNNTCTERTCLLLYCSNADAY